MHQTLRRLLETAPKSIAVELTLACDRELLGQIRTVTAKPRNITKFKLHEARRIVEHLTDPVTLGRVYRTDKRIGVRQIVRSHPLWDLIPHQDRCNSCQTNPTLPVQTEDEILTALNSRPCDEQIAETLLARPHLGTREVWETIFERYDGRCDRLLVEIAAGTLTVPDQVRTPAGPSVSRANLRRLLDMQPCPNGALITLAAGRPMPAHWTLTETQWTALTVTDPRGAIGSGIPLPLLLELLDRLTDQELSNALPHSLTLVEDGDDLAAIIAAVERIDAARRIELVKSNRQTWSRLTLELLRTNRKLQPVDRLRLVTLNGAQIIAAIVTDPRIALTAGETNELVELLCRHDTDGTLARKLASAFTDRYVYMGERASAELGNSMVDHLPLPVIVSTLPPDELMGKIHQRLWAALDVDTHGGTLAGMINDWCGTVDELIECVKTIG